MAEDHIRYDILAQEALRGVVRKVLSEVEKSGLVGEHHFFISFDTGAPGVRISQTLHEQYPNEMTIVLQNQFWDLKVSDSFFEVGLSFDGQAENLCIPFSAIKGFFDPSVQFGLQFEVRTHSEAKQENGATEPTPSDMADSEKQVDASNAPESDETEAAQQEKIVKLDSFRKK